MVKLILLIITLTLTPLVFAQQFANPNFGSGSPTTPNLSILPTGWQNVAATDTICQVPNQYQGLGDTPDLTNINGPMSSVGIFGYPKSGTNFVSGVRGNNFHEGIQQSVAGFTVGKQYTLSFYQAVVKQENCKDTTGSWSVYLDGVLTFTSAPTTSLLSYDDPTLNWEMRQFDFTALTTQITFSFLPEDDDNNLSTTSFDEDAALRMGLDELNLEEVPSPVYYYDTTLCNSNSYSVSLNYPNANYLWDDNSTSSSTVFHGNDIKTVEITVPDSVFTEVYDVHFFDKQSAILPLDTVICEGQTVTIQSPQNDYNFEWQDGSETNSITINENETITYTIVEDQCIFTDTMNVSVSTYPEVEILDTTVCFTTNYQATYPAQFDYQWSNGLQSNVFSSNNSGVFTATIANGNCVISESFELTIEDQITAPQINDTVLCFGETLNLTSPNGNFTATWNNGSTQTLFVDTSGTYSLNLANQCENITQNFNVTVVPELTVNLGSDVELCSKESLLLTPHANVNGNLTWQDGSNANEYLATTAGTYTLQLEYMGCTTSDTLELTYTTPLQLNLGNDTTICAINNLVLNAYSTDQAVNYFWNTGDNTAEIVVSEEGYYSVEISNQCEMVTDEIYVSVETCSPSVYAPNTFTPNGDAYNNFFNFESDTEFDRFEWTVYNRWGEVIFQANSIHDGWDGTFNNQACQDGTYVWKITYSTSGSAYVEQESGMVTLLR